MDKINKETEDMISFLDKLKLEILDAAKEETGTYKDKDEEKIFGFGH